MKHAKSPNRKGFTIIELMLAMGFLSTLLVTISLLIILITGIYQKGLSMRAVNSVGKQIIDDMSRVIGGSPIVLGINPEDTNGNGKFDESEVTTAVKNYYYSSESGSKQYRGAFCTGSYSFIWNTKYSYDEDPSRAFKLTRDPSTDADGAMYKLARVADTDRSVCKVLAHPDTTNTRLLQVASDPIEMINSDESDLVLYDFTIFPATQNRITGQTFYSATFILATIRGGVNIDTAGDFCDVDSGSVIGLTSDFNYCAVNKFNFAMRATGYSEGEDQYGERGI